jgi:hypothetical protein
VKIVRKHAHLLCTYLPEIVRGLHQVLNSIPAFCPAIGQTRLARGSLMRR